MRHSPAFLYQLARRPAISAPLPAIGSHVYRLDASAPGTVFMDQGGATPAANGQAVARVNDAGTGGSLWGLQTTSALRPTFLHALQAGRPGLRFTGSDQWMPLIGVTNPGTLFQSRSFTLLAVYRRSALDVKSTPFAAGSATSGQGGLWFDNITLFSRENGVVALDRHTGSDYNNVSATGYNFPAGQLVKVVARGGQAEGLELRVRGLAGSNTVTAPMSATADSWTWDTAAIGAAMGDPTKALPRTAFVGDLFEVGFWAARASDANMTALQLYADSKWGA